MESELKKLLSDLDIDDLKESHSGAMYWTLKLLERSITDIIVKEARFWDEEYEKEDARCSEEHPDWDHKDRRYEDVDVARAYSAKNILWELCSDISNYFETAWGYEYEQ